MVRACAQADRQLALEVSDLEGIRLDLLRLQQDASTLGRLMATLDNARLRGAQGDDMPHAAA